MKGVITKLAALSICPCGAPVLNDEIGLGTEYVIYPETVRHGFTYGCGACGKVQEDVAVVKADSRVNPAAEPRWLPLALFELVVMA